ncbi:hypothetical protein HELRODRAFT_169373 [Helobdella robusta]|uniref:GPI transamidase component PIG-T n=1 Tax=Helobdella robusta TaxID=6412 RepID=T1F1V3_HELRO|nr:hypothetical protein HELRODRAFT_169373 [Helobdella robusta]ESO08512.1 hypothetical protein HELRODRAFT_169373 [Helobdella robusta]
MDDLLNVKCFVLVSVLIICSVSVSSTALADQFHEELFIKTLPTGQLYNHFRFTTIWNVSLNSSQSKHYRLFPRALGEVFETFSVKELSLSFTQGRWRHESWGYPVLDASKGAELLVWFSAQKTKIDSAWSELVNVLSGMFCASLNFMDVKTTVTPKLNFRPTGYVTENYKKYFSNHVRYAVLSNENVCTENLTPWKKLLPCGFRAGLSTLLNAFKLYDSSYHSLNVQFRHVCLNEKIEPLKIFYQPGKDNGRPYHLEVLFNLPANSVARLSFQFEKQLLKWTDYPPDPNHGFYIAPSVINFILPNAGNITSLKNNKHFFTGLKNSNKNDAYTFTLHTEALLITLPTPDFSMPYNVICLVCTVIAIAFGSVHNLTTKSFVMYDPQKHKNIFRKLKDKFWKKKEKLS